MRKGVNARIKHFICKSRGPNEASTLFVYYSLPLYVHLQAVFRQKLDVVGLEGSSSPMISHKD